MAQHDFVIDNAPGQPVRLDLQAAVQALVSMNSGPVEPVAKFPGMLWLDTSVSPDGVLRQRNQANLAWVVPQLSGLSAIAAPLLLNGNAANGRVIFNGTTPVGVQFTAADFSLLARTGSPNLLVVNNKPDGSGADVFVINADTGAITLVSTLTLAADPALPLQAATKQYVDAGLAKGVWEVIYNQVVAAQAAVALINLGVYKFIRIRGQLTITANGTSLNLQFSNDNGATYLQAATDYNLQRIFQSVASITGGIVTVTAVQIDALTGLSNAVNSLCTFLIDCEAFNQAVQTTGHCHCMFREASGAALRGAFTDFETQQKLVHNALRIIAGAGTFSGPLLVEGCR